MTHRGPERSRHLRGARASHSAYAGSASSTSTGGHQPFANEDGDDLGVQNGELYNHDDDPRRARRRGHSFAAGATPRSCRTSTRSTGRASPSSSAASSGSRVWDGRKRRAVIARDRLGIKPLYYADAGDLLVFALGAEERPRERARRHRARLRGDRRLPDARLRPGPATPLAGGAEARCRDTGSSSTTAGVAPSATGRTRSRRRAELSARGELGERCSAARRSGAAPADERRAAGRDAQRRARLEPDRRADGAPHDRARQDVLGRLRRGRRWNELADARFVAQHFGTDHHELELSFAEQTVDLAELVWHLDEPVADLSALGLPRAVASSPPEQVTVALSGQGADELLGGYRKHRAAAHRRALAAPAGAAAARRQRCAALRRRTVRGGRVADACCSRTRPSGSLAMSGVSTGDVRAELVRGRSRELDGGRGAAAISDAARRRRPTIRCPRRSTSTASSGSSTTCSTTSTARRWRTRSRCACRSSTTTWSSSARRSRRGIKVRGWTRSTC